MTTVTLVRGVDTSPWTVPAGVIALTVECWGAGGGGGGNSLTTDGGSGGGGGAYSRRQIIVTPGQTISFSIGQGGTAGAATADAIAGTGGTTWFVANSVAGIVAVGGAGGRAPTAGGVPYVGGLGGAAASGFGETTFSGGKGEAGRDQTNGRGGYGGSSAGTAADGLSGPDTWSTQTFPIGSLPTGAAAGGDGGAASPGTPTDGAVGGGGGGGRGDAAGVGGVGGDGKIVLTYTADLTAPTLSNPTVTNITTTGGTPQVNTDDASGTIYMVVVPNNDTPSTAQIKAGQQSSGAAALAAESSILIPNPMVFSAVTGLTQATPYDVWFVHTDEALNDSTAVKADFTTLSAGNSNSTLFWAFP